MSSPSYNIDDIRSLQDDYMRRKVDEHFRIDRLAKANAGLFRYTVEKRDPQYPNPPILYHITFLLKSFIGIDEMEQPIIGEQHEMSIELPQVFPEQSAKTKMRTPIWHPNVKSSGPFAGDICTNHKGFGSLYFLDELIVRIGEFLQYKRYLAEDRKPWPEDPAVARWVKKIGEPKGYINKEEEKFVDERSWTVFFDDVLIEIDEDDDDDFEIIITEK